MCVYDRQPIGTALRRFKKLLERSGVVKELRRRKHCEQPSEDRRRAEQRKRTAAHKARNQSSGE
jgi:small subunit ribosomal protein S21